MSTTDVLQSVLIGTLSVCVVMQGVAITVLKDKFYYDDEGDNEHEN